MQRRNRLASATAQLRALDPGNTLARGYAIARDGQGRIVRDAAALAPGQALDLSFAQGGAEVSVTATRDSRDAS
ncbi:Exodeoxyribonuclease 7 large subunit [Achromobacter anxifer]|uniref:Exodeoxyribonuclease 7 large subunit n=1 Tax=Achromobacter anxifer TaxID=1287737 RepID=A0A6S7ET93_9BURK|nr:Exodeoxyribonuclease 7 large subunit [Achromobacter anxifer]